MYSTRLIVMLLLQLLAMQQLATGSWRISIVAIAMPCIGLLHSPEVEGLSAAALMSVALRSESLTVPRASILAQQTSRQDHM
jgi:hypothetical protein